MHPDIFVWESQFETGIAELDRQHRHLVEQINSLGILLHSRKDGFEKALLRILEALSDYADFHFRYEEALMLHLGDAGQESAHRQSHADFLRQLDEAKAEAAESPVEVTGKLLAFLSGWLMVHILVTDSALAKRIVAMESGSPVEEAGQQTEKLASESNEILLQAMNRLYGHLVSRTSELSEIRARLQRETDFLKLMEFELHKFSSVVEHSPVSILITDKKGIFEYVNPKFTELTGYAFHELDGKTPSILKSGFMPDEIYGMLWQTISSGHEWHGEFRNRKKNGELYWDHASISPIFDQNGKITHYVAVQENITERKGAVEELRHQKEFSEVIVNSLPGIFYMLDEEGGIVKVNPQFLETTGYSPKEIMAMNALEFFEGSDKVLISERISEVFANGESWAEADLIVKGGRKIPHFFTWHRTFIDGQTYLVGLGTDISERKMLEQELVHQARTDMLTGLPNRRRFLELAEQELARATRYDGQLSVLMIDLDNFKSINDVHGHQSGDRVLAKFAEICRKTMRSIDIAGRLGGEEFAILLPETDLQHAVEAAERLRQRIADTEMAMENGKNFGFTASFGAASLSPDNDNIDRLLGAADRALYEAKRTGRNRVVRA